VHLDRGVLGVAGEEAVVVDDAGGRGRRRGVGVAAGESAPMTIVCGCAGAGAGADLRAGGEVSL